MTIRLDDPNVNQGFIPCVVKRFWSRRSFMKGFHTWPVHGRTYVMCVKFSPVGYTSIQITGILVDMSGCLCCRVTS
jgi:hypothetical protein